MYGPTTAATASALKPTMSSRTTALGGGGFVSILARPPPRYKNLAFCAGLGSCDYLRSCTTPNNYVGVIDGLESVT